MKPMNASPDNEPLNLVINLDRCPERLADIGNRLRALGLDFERVVAVDAQQLDDQSRAQLDAEAYRRKHGKEPIWGELGCYLSHVRAMQQLLGSQHEYALILEDDVGFTDVFKGALAGLLACPQAWDMVKLSGSHSGTPVAVRALGNGSQLAVMLSRCTTSSAYLVNRRAASVYCQQLLPMSLPYDHVFDQGWRFGIKVRMVTPLPCLHDFDVPTTITGQAAKTRKFHWSKRFPAYGYRLKNELQRLGYALGQILQAYLSGR